MKQFAAKGIVLSRTDYAEADRIITFLTQDNGKVRALAKGVRKSQSKLAGGLELFSVSELSFIAGRGELNTLISSRLVKHYSNIVLDLQRTNAAYEAIRLTDKATEDAAEAAYFSLLRSLFAALDEFELNCELTMLWFEMQLLRLSGHSPNLKIDISGDKLSEDASYNFYLDRMHFSPGKSAEGKFTARDIKFLRLGFAAERPHILNQITDSAELSATARPLVRDMIQNFVSS